MSHTKARCPEHGNQWYVLGRCSKCETQRRRYVAPSNVFAIDPGTTQSAYVQLETGLTDHLDDVADGCPYRVKRKGKVDNADLLSILAEPDREFDRVVIEMIASYGMPVGREVFETVVWIGRYVERYQVAHGFEAALLYRREVKVELCNSARAKDANVRQSIIDIFPPTGGGKKPVIGIKSNPGPLFGVAGDVWAALGVAITFDRLSRQPAPPF